MYVGFDHINIFRFDKNCLEEVYGFLRKAGRERFEAVGLFAGTIENDEAFLSKGVIPLQKSYKLDMGLMYVVDGAELHRINVSLHKAGLKLIAQIHTHPMEAYHSDTDDEYPIMSTVGGLSIVVPNFASGPMSFQDWAFYRLRAQGVWDELSSDQVTKLIQLS